MFLFILSSCLKEQPLYRDDERNFNATIMQNKIHDTWSLSTGFFYGIKEDGVSYTNTIYRSILGFDSLYVEGYQYRVALKEVCRNYLRFEDALMDAHTCELRLIEIKDRYPVEEEFIVPNPYE